jgi:hypothetical protein
VDAAEPKNLQLPYLETFSKAAELSSFTGAAKALSLTQASISQRVQALEKTLGAALFRRQGGPAGAAGGWPVSSWQAAGRRPILGCRSS